MAKVSFSEFINFIFDICALFVPKKSLKVPLKIDLSTSRLFNSINKLFEKLIFSFVSRSPLLGKFLFVFFKDNATLFVTSFLSFF